MRRNVTCLLLQVSLFQGRYPTKRFSAASLERRITEKKGARILAVKKFE